MIRTLLMKEWKHIRKDKQTVFIILAWPLVMILFFGYAITMELRRVPLLVDDRSHSVLSRSVASGLASSSFFELHFEATTSQRIMTLFRQNRYKAVLVIPPDFAKQFVRSQARVQLLLDASDPNEAALIQGYINGVLQRVSMGKTHSVGGILPIVRVFYNPNMKSAYFFVPGLTAIIMLLLSTLLTSITLVREKEMGTMNQLLVSPVRPMAIVLGKVIPYVGLSFLSGTLVILVGRLWFHVPMSGSYLLLALILMLYVMTGASLGMLVSSLVSSQKMALLVTIMATLLPSLLLSGFMFPIESMPMIFQWLAQIVPATHFIILLRSILLKGQGVSDLWPHILALGMLSFVLLAVSLKRTEASFK